MYISMSWLEADRAPELITAFQGGPGSPTSPPVSSTCRYGSPTRTREILMVSRWSDKEAFTAYMRSEDTGCPTPDRT
jgi:hypothetical protein